MKLYFAPLAVSLASRIALYHADIDVTFVRVNRWTKRLRDGGDYRDVHRLGTVPALLTDEGTLITESAAVLQYIAARGGSAAEASTDPTELQRWLSFIGTELHKGIFWVLFDAEAPDAAKRHALERGRSRLEYVDAHLEGRPFLLDALSVADMYLYAVLNWTQASPVELDDYPALAAFHRRMQTVPAVARAFADERPLYLEDHRENRAQA